MKKFGNLKILLLILNLVVIARLFFICIIKHDYYLKEYNDLTNKIVYSAYPPRGRILDTNGNILVDNKGIKVIIYNKIPGIKINEEIDIIKKIASVIDIDTKNVTNLMLKEYYYLLNEDYVDGLINNNILERYEKRQITKDDLIKYRLSLIGNEELKSISKEEALLYNLMNKGYLYQDKVIKSDITDEEFTKINELNLKGIRIDIKWVRAYNYDTVLNTLFGAIGNIPAEESEDYIKNGYALDDIVGVSFLEKYYEKYLRGVKGTYKVNDDNTLTKVSEEKRGNDLVLSIDIEKQLKIEEVLRKEILNAKEYISSKYYKGSYIVVSDPNTGDILALVAYKYDNEVFTSDVIGLLTNSYTVGSVVKGASHSVAYINGVIDIDKKIKDGCVKLYSQKEKCSWKSLGYLNDIDALTYSSNYYQFINAIKVTGNKYRRNMKFTPTFLDFNKYRDIFKEYGLGEYTGIDLFEEELGIKGSNISGDLLLNLSIGQYDTYTPLELNQYIATIANGTNRYKLRIANKIITIDGKSIEINKKESLNKLSIDKKYMDRIHEGFRNVVLRGTASSYVNKKYNAAGKTGTSETFYNGKSTTTKSFVMYAPNDNPEVAISIISPHISYKNNISNYNYPINSRLSRQITEILFEK